MGASLRRMLSVSVALAIGGAVLPDVAAAAAPASADGIVTAADACTAAMRDYPLDDATASALRLRRHAWHEIADGSITGRWEESSWSATSDQIAALQVAAAWMRPELLDELQDVDDRTRRSAEDDLVWAVQHLADEDLAQVLPLGLAERTAVIDRSRRRAQPPGPVREQPRSDAAAAAERPTDADTRPDVPIDELRRFDDRVATARDQLPREAAAALDRQTDEGLVHDLGATAAQLDWVLQQGERGAELLRSWGDDTAAYAALLRSVVDRAAAVDSYGGVLDACVGALADRAGDERLDDERARELARRDIAGRLDRDGSIRTVSATTPGSAHVRACAATIVDHAREFRLDDDGDATVSSTEAPADLDEAWRGEGIDPGDDRAAAAERTVRFWAEHADDGVVREWIDRVARDAAETAAKALVRCLGEVPRAAEEERRVDTGFLAAAAERSVRRTLDELGVPAVDEPAYPQPADPAPDDPAPVEPAPAGTTPTPAPAPQPTTDPTPEPTPTASHSDEPTEAPAGEPTASPTSSPSSAPPPLSAPPSPAPSASVAIVDEPEPEPAPIVEPVVEPIDSTPTDATPASTSEADPAAPAVDAEPSGGAPVVPPTTEPHRTPASSATDATDPTDTDPVPAAPAAAEGTPLAEAAPAVAAARADVAVAVSERPASPGGPPLGLLAVLVPIAAGGAITATVAARRLRR